MLNFRSVPTFNVLHDVGGILTIMVPVAFPRHRQSDIMGPKSTDAAPQPRSIVVGALGRDARYRSPGRDSIFVSGRGRW